MTSALDLSSYTMPPELREALDKAKLHVMTPKERYEQMVSFIYGMQRLSEPGLSIEEIKAMLAKGGTVEPASNGDGGGSQ